MKQYSEYKNSGVEWIGKMPNYWSCKRFKFALSSLESGNREVGGGNQLLDGVFSVGGEHVGWFGEIFTEGKKFISEEYYARMTKGKIKERDVLLVKDGATIGKCAFVHDIPDGKAAVNEHVFLMRANSNYDDNYIFYFIWSYVGQEQINLQVRGSAQPGLNSLFQNYLLIPALPFQEQKSIAEFLDRKASQIDDLIAKKERMIELLKEERSAVINQAVTKGLTPPSPSLSKRGTEGEFKDSGVEWLGKVPKHWEVKKLKFNASVRFSNVNKKSEEGEQIIRLCNYVDVYYNDFITSNLDFMEATASLEEIKKFQLRLGDVIVTKDSEEWNDIAVPAYVVSELPNVICGYHLAQIRSKENLIVGKYLFWLLSADCINYQFKIETSGVTRYGLGNYALSNSIILIPPKKEQKNIIDYLDYKTVQIDTQVLREKKSIKLLKEYRTALISEVVTGKIDVRGI